MKDVGIVGLPGAGCSTIFTALTALPGATPGHTSVAVLPVPDDRVDVLARLQGSARSTHAQLRFVETSGMVRRGARGGGGALSAELLGRLREADALLLVLRAFGGADPAADLADLELELVYADLAVVAAKAQRDAKAARTAEEKRALAALEEARALLEAGTPMRARAWDGPEAAAFAGLALLTLKPAVAVANVGEDAPPAPDGMVRVAGALEVEVAGLPDDEAAELLAPFGVAERGVPAVVRALYERLDLITFLTANQREARTWEVRRGSTAPEAAGTIHTDMQRGFIRADVVPFDALVEAGSWHAARVEGLLRAEGKTYVIAEADVVEFRFSV